jgi:hypothetical protein
MEDLISSSLGLIKKKIPANLSGEQEEQVSTSISCCGLDV